MWPKHSTQNIPPSCHGSNGYVVVCVQRPPNPQRACLHRWRTHKCQSSRGLSPAALTTIHESDAFAALRAELHAFYSQAPVNGTRETLQEYLRHQEAVPLEPRLDGIRAEMSRGSLGAYRPYMSRQRLTLGAGLLGVTYGLVSGNVASAAIGALAGLAALRDEQRSTRATGTAPLWRALIADHADEAREFRGVDYTDASRDEMVDRAEGGHPWGIAREASRSIVVSQGLLKAPHLGLYDSADVAPSRSYNVGVYVDCPCGSGRKYRFCCAGIWGVHKPLRPVD